MAKSALMHIFKAGTQITAAGEEITFGESDLAACAAAYDPAKHEASICVGHPKSDAPAYGWIKGLSARGADLLAERHQVQVEFAEMCREGRFKKVSAAFYSPKHKRNPVPGVWYLRHVAMLGAEPPAVKGLRAVEFAEGDGGNEDDGQVAFAEVEFSDPAITSVASMFGRLRDWFISKHGVEAADGVLPRWEIDSINDLGMSRAYPAREGEDAAVTSAFSEATPSPPQPTPQETDLSNPDPQAQADLASAIKRAEAAELALRESNAAAAAAAARARHDEAVAFAESLYVNDQLLPKDRDMVVAALDALEGEAPTEFGEGDARQPVGKALRAFLQGLPKHSLNGEHVAKRRGRADGDADDEGLPEFSEGALIDDARMQMHRQATALAKDKGIPYIEAARQLARG